MPDKPAAEVAITAETVRELIDSQAVEAIPNAASQPLAKAAEGWDNELWRLGSRLAVRLPRRALAAPLILHEQAALPAIAERLVTTGVRVPAPVFAGRPAECFPWHWSVVPWLEGVRALDTDRAARSSWAESLAHAVSALHETAPQGHPVNPVRGVPLIERALAVDERFEMLREAGRLPRALLDPAAAAWRAGLEAPAWARPPVWIHGDLHPGNLVIRDGALAAIIDFGDVTAGDPAYDLAVAWLAFDAYGRTQFRAATRGRYDDATWTRAAAWAAAFAVLLLARSDDDPDYAALGRDALEQVMRR
ncbi:aminoglycoside phosphotransferase family protein [Microbacterium sp. SS28]|uniref:aminoglycoside phosphotransferase family protein n=1 Tax=Microbacterium sp. SS28 TaxID=2919948 RepID=UPI001FA9A05D|nr:aminoglycoside phosphotransferase family protein [Microbacterium sp. SS28]